MEYRYLGVIINQEGTDDKEIRARMKAIGSLNEIFWNPKLTKRRKYKIYNAVVKSILTHVAESWGLSEVNVERKKQWRWMRLEGRLANKERQIKE
jgi:hypothetical protein